MATDREKAEAWQAEQSQRCPECGVYEWADDVEADWWTCEHCREAWAKRRAVTDHQTTDGMHLAWFPKGSGEVLERMKAAGHGES